MPTPEQLFSLVADELTLACGGVYSRQPMTVKQLDTFSDRVLLLCERLKKEEKVDA